GLLHPSVVFAGVLAGPLRGAQPSSATVSSRFIQRTSPPSYDFHERSGAWKRTVNTRRELLSFDSGSPTSIPSTSPAAQPSPFLDTAVRSAADGTAPCGAS